MKKTIKLTCLLLSIALLITVFTACNNNNDDPPDEQNYQEDTTEPTETNDAEDEEQTETTGNGEIDTEFVFSHSMNIDENGFWEGITATDYIRNIEELLETLPDNVETVSDDIVESEIANIIASFPSGMPVTDRPVENGDRVNIDYVGSIDGVEFAGGSTGGAGADVTAGSTEYIDDFLFQIIGHMPGDTVNVEVTFPTDYHAADLAGKEALFVTVINYILGAPELTDDFVYSNFNEFYGWSNVAEMENDIRNDIQANDIRQYFSAIEIETIPPMIIEYFENFILHSYVDAAQMYNMTLDEFLVGYAGVANVEELMETNKEFIIEMSTLSLIIQAIAETENIRVATNDIEDYFWKFYGTNDYSAVEAQYGLPYLKQFILTHITLNHLVENIFI